MTLFDSRIRRRRLPRAEEEGADDSLPIVSETSPTIYVHGEINERLARQFVEAVANLRANGITTVVVDIDSPGGSILALYQMLGAIWGSDSMQFITYCSGAAYSAAAVLLTAGTPGMRFISPFGSVMIHGILYDPGFQGIEEHVTETTFASKENARLFEILAANIGTTVAKLQRKVRDCGSRNWWLMPDEAMDEKIVDVIGVPAAKVNPEVVVSARVLAAREEVEKPQKPRKSKETKTSE